MPNSMSAAPKRQEQNTAILVAAMAAIAILASGCGNVANQNLHSAAAQAQTDAAASLYTGGSAVDSEGNLLSIDNHYGDYKCPSDPNVVPVPYEFDADASRRYRACKPSNSNSTKVLLHGRTTGEKRICIFPIQYNNEYDVHPIVDKTSGHTIRRCYELPTGGSIPQEGLETSFDNTTYNALIITEGSDDLRMDYCMTTNGVNLGLCPRYSLGKFK